MYFQGVCVRQVCTFQRDRDVSECVFGDLVTVLAAWLRAKVGLHRFALLTPTPCAVDVLNSVAPSRVRSPERVACVVCEACRLHFDLPVARERERERVRRETHHHHHGRVSRVRFLL